MQLAKAMTIKKSPTTSNLPFHLASTPTMKKKIDFICLKKYRNFCDFMSLWPSLERKTFLDCIKVNIYGYANANKIVENNDFMNDF